MSNHFISEQTIPEYNLSGKTETSSFDAQQSLIQTFMTHRMSDENIQALTTGRDKEFKDVMVSVEKSLASKPGQALQHALIYGPRGFGKSFMTRMIQVELDQMKLKQINLNQVNREAEGLPKETAFILLPEEQQNLTRNPHALLNYLTAKLKDWQTGEDNSWQDAMFQWPDKKRMAALWKEAEQNLEQQLDSCFPAGNGLVIVAIENFDTLLNSVFKDEAAEQRLRKWLDRRNNRIMLLATATGMVDMDYERALFQAFRSIRLSPWTQDDCIAYFNKRRELDKKAHLSDEQEAKARAITDFIGGNPRLAQLLYTVIDSHDAMTVVETMNMLADKLSDYYRSRIEDLPPLAQGLLDALIRGGEPASSTELAKRVGASGQNEIARVIDDLKKADLITGKQAPGSRQKLFQVTDRVFVHCYHLQQGNDSLEGSLLLNALDLLSAFYSVDDEKHESKNIVEEATNLRIQTEGGATGYNLATRSQLMARSDFFHVLRDTITLSSEGVGTQTSETLVIKKQWLYEVVSGFVAKCTDSDILTDLKLLLEEVEQPNSATLLSLLEQLILFDIAEKPDVVLARMDPDIATWIKHIRQSEQSKIIPESA